MRGMWRERKKGKGKSTQKWAGCMEQSRKPISGSGIFPLKPLNTPSMVEFALVCVCMQVYLSVFVCYALLSPR